MAFIVTVEKIIITYVLGEHNPGSAQNLKTSNDFCTAESAALPAALHLEIVFTLIDF